MTPHPKPGVHASPPSPHPAPPAHFILPPLTTLVSMSVCFAHLCWSLHAGLLCMANESFPKYASQAPLKGRYQLDFCLMDFFFCVCVSTATKKRPVKSKWMFGTSRLQLFCLHVEFIFNITMPYKVDISIPALQGRKGIRQT